MRLSSSHSDSRYKKSFASSKVVPDGITKFGIPVCGLTESAMRRALRLRRISTVISVVPITYVLVIKSFGDFLLFVTVRSQLLCGDS